MDIKILDLEKECDVYITLQDQKLLGKCAFKIASFYKSQNNIESSVKWFKKTLTHESNLQEKYMSCIYLYEYSNNKELELNYLVEASNYDSERPEWISFLLQSCYNKGHFKLANDLYSGFKNFYENKYIKEGIDFNSKLLPIDISLYDFHIPFNMIIVAWNVKDFELGIKMFEIIFSKKCIINSPSLVECVLRNLQFFIDHAKNNDTFILLNEYLKFIHDNNLANFDSVGWLKNYSAASGNNIDLSYIFPKSIVNFNESQCKDSKNILFYTGCCKGGWNISYLKENALGGSEKAAIYVITELSKILPDDWKIYVCGGVGAEKVDNIEFIDDSELNSLITTTPFYSLIVSRWITFFDLHPDTSFYKSYVWAHDLFFFTEESSFNNLKANQILSRWDKNITKYVCLTEWHKNLFQNTYPIIKDKIILNNNGITPEIFPKDVKKKPNSFIYTSRAERGLSVLLNLWPQILEKIPDATLNIASYVDFPLDYGGQPEMKKFIDSNSSITHLGKLKTSELYDLMAESEYWLYPCVFNETSCITALEMLMSEVICLYYPSAGLTDTMSDFGIQLKPGNEIETLMSLTEESEALKSSMRFKGKEYATKCSWENRAKVWKNIIFNPSIDLSPGEELFDFEDYVSSKISNMSDFSRVLSEKKENEPMKCIYSYLFSDEMRIYTFLESIFIYGELDCNTHILICTSTSLMNKIKQNHLFDNDKIKFEINDKSRMDFFDFESSKNYSKVLYLDTSVIVKDNINKVFDICMENVVYVIDDKSLDNSPIILFNNCDKIKDVFNQLKDVSNKTPEDFDNTTLKSIFSTDDSNISSDKVIHYFSSKKSSEMSNFLYNIKDFTIKKNIQVAKRYIDLYLMPIIKSIRETLEGNIFMMQATTVYTNVFENKTKNISNLVLNKNIKNVMEIGFNSGFSTLLMLLTNPSMHITCFDLGYHRYTLPCYNKLKETFGDRINIILGDSTVTLPKINDFYDLIHIDGGHETFVAESDITNSYRLSKNGTILIMDDYDYHPLHQLWDNYIDKYKIKPLNISLYDSPHHDIKYVIKK